MDAPAQRGIASRINPEAGSHVVSLDPVEREAAAAATARSWRAYPYYPQRFGKRGWNFSLSDSGWLQTLVDLSPAEAREQSRWLASVLSARGMPSLLLEHHLGWLHQELCARKPGSDARYARLLDCRDDLRSVRLPQIADDAQRSLVSMFDDAVASVPERVDHFGILLVAAVADERAGYAGAVDSLLEWAADPRRFGEAWRDAVHATVAAARAAPSANPVEG